MKLGAVKIVVFKNAVLATLMADVNNYTSGFASFGYAAGDVGEREYIGERSYYDGAAYVMILYYAG